MVSSISRRRVIAVAASIINNYLSALQSLKASNKTIGPRRLIARRVPSFSALPREVCNALISASESAASRTCNTFPLSPISVKSAQNSFSASSSAVRISCVEGAKDKSLSPDIPMGRAMARPGLVRSEADRKVNGEVGHTGFSKRTQEHVCPKTRVDLVKCEFRHEGISFCLHQGKLIMVVRRC